MGCGRRAAQSELLRFAAVDGMLTAGRALPGRGAYTCLGLACFEQALNGRAFARTLRRAVSVEPGIERLYNERSHG